MRESGGKRWVGEEGLGVVGEGVSWTCPSAPEGAGPAGGAWPLAAIPERLWLLTWPAAPAFCPSPLLLPASFSHMTCSDVCVCACVLIDLLGSTCWCVLCP